MIKACIKLLRIKHCIKNALIFMPLVFSKELFSSLNLFAVMVLAFIAFSIISSTIYIFNDIGDKERDARHPIKCKRPIASGAISTSLAWKIVITLGTIGLALAAWIASFTSWWGFAILLIYLLFNIAYSAGVKSMPILEIAILSSGFLLRVLYGGHIAGIEVSGWLYLTVLSMSFYLGLGKRRNELDLHGSTSTRKVLRHYNRRFLDRNMYVFLTAGICFYSLWAISQGEAMLWSVPMVMLTCMRYSLVVENGSEGDPVELILKDKTLLLLGSLYGIYMFIALYWPQL